METYPNYPTNDSYVPLTSLPRLYSIPVNRPVRLYCDGIYDLFHYGHMLSLKQVKNLFEKVELLVGVCNDELTHKLKGKTVYTYEERLECVKHSAYVDEVIENAPWVIDEDFMNKWKIDYVVHDEIPYEFKGSDNKCDSNPNTPEDTSTDASSTYSENDVYFYVKTHNRFIPSMRTRGISTSGIITRIIKDYDEFVRRNLERGISAKDLNVGIIDENIIKVKSKVKNEMREMKEEIRIAMCFWEKMGKEFVKIFEVGEERIRSRLEKIFGQGRGKRFIDRCKNVADKLNKKRRIEKDESE